MMINKNKPDNIRPLFSSPVRDFSLPDLVQGKIEDVYDEIELFGFSCHNELVRLCLKHPSVAKYQHEG